MPEMRHDDELDSIRHENRLIRDQVDALQIAASAKPRRFYQNPSLILSIVALTLSTGFSGTAVMRAVRDKTDQRESAKEARVQAQLGLVRDHVTELAELRTEEMEEQATMIAEPMRFASRSSIRNVRRQVLLEDSEVLLDSLKERVSSQILNAFAYEHQMDSRFAAAEKLYLQALENAKDSTVALVAVRSGLGSLYMGPGTPVHDVGKGRAHFAHVARILSSREDEYGLQQRASMFMNLAWYELMNGDTAAAGDAVRSAREAISRLQDNNPVKHQFTSTLDQTYDKAARPIAAGNANPDPVTDFMGSWTLAFPEEISGRLEVTLLQPNGAPFASVELFVSDALIGWYRGPAVSEGSGKWTITWAGMAIGPNGPNANVMGVTKVTLGAKGDSRTGVQMTLGQEQVAFSLSRAY